MWLNLLGPALRLAAGTAQAKASLTRLAVALGLLLIALILAVAALVFALGALDGYLASFLSDPAAAAAGVARRRAPARRGPRIDRRRPRPLGATQSVGSGRGRVRRRHSHGYPPLIGALTGGGIREGRSTMR